jgi:uncharacterized protein YjbI with pentapeptide repeats/beta-lactamase regulating signal transducer with metallopeptidase domain
VIQIAHFAFATLLNSLWEAPLIALLTWLCLRATPKCSASTRYVGWLIALLAASILPPITVNIQSAPRTTSTAWVEHVARTAGPAARATRPKQPVVNPPSVTAARSIERPRVTLPQNIIFGIAAAWAAAVALFALRLLVELFQLERFKRDALPLPFEYRDALSRWSSSAGYGRDTRICVSPHTDVPVAIGLFDAMILLPQQLLAELSPGEIEHIALHELAHLRRHDDWFNAVERVLVVLYFFNPAIRWIAAQLDVEREVACDDHVVDVTHEVRPYAHCLTRMAEVTQWPRVALAAPGVFVTRKSMSIRIERLLRAGTSRRVRISYATAIASLVLIGLVFAGAQRYGPVIAAPLTAAPAKTVAMPKTKPHRIAETPKPRKIALARPAPSPSPAARATPGPTLVARTEPPKKAVHKTKPRRATAAPRGLQAVGLPRCDGCNLAGINWRGRDLRGIVLHGANLSGADLRDADLRNADLSGSNLQDAQLAGARLDGAQLSGINLAGAMLRGVDIRGANISGANVDTAGMDIATLRELLNSCSGCNFGDLDARGKDLSGLHISGVNLGDADLRQANLRNTVFNGVNFAGVRLQGAQLDGAEFNGCNFADVDLRGVDLSHAKLTGSNISNAIMQ